MNGRGRGRYVLKRFAVVFVCAFLVSSMMLFGVPGTGYDGSATRDAEAFACGGLCIAGIGVLAVSSAAAGTVIASSYFNETADSQSEAYYLAQNLDDRIETDTATVKNSLESTRTMAYREAETAFAEAMANESTKTDAQLAAVNATEEYLKTVINDEMIRRNNAFVSTSRNIMNTSGVSSSQGTGGEVTVKIWSSTSNPVNYSVSYLSYNGEKISWFPDGKVSSTTTTASVDFSFNDNDFDKITLNNTKLPIGSYASIRGEVVNEIDNFTDNITKSQYDSLTADEIVSPANQALEWGESYNDTGSSGYASALASSLGFGTAETGTTYYVDMPAGDNSSDYVGQIFADEATIPNNTIKTGKVYNGSSTTAWVATSSGMTALDEDWKVLSIELRDGTQVESTNLSTWSKQELNASAPLETLEEWQELQNETSLLGEVGGLLGGLSVGDGFIPFLPGGNLLHGLIVLGGAYVFLGREETPGPTVVQT